MQGLLRSMQRSMEESHWALPFPMTPCHLKNESRKTGRSLIRLPTIYHSRMLVSTYNRYEWESEDFQVRYIRCSLESENAPPSLTTAEIPPPDVQARAATNELQQARALRNDSATAASSGS